MKTLLYNSYRIYAYTVFAITLVLFYPITALLVLHPKTRKMSTGVFWFWSLVLSLFFLIFVRKNKVKIPDEPLIIIANHTSYLDIFMMYQIVPFRHIVFMGKSEILNYPLIKTYFKHLHIPVDRIDKRKAAQSMLQAKRKIAEGWSIVIFPEGGIPDHMAPEMLDFKPGAFVMAQKNKVAILPISLINHYQLLAEPQNLKASSRPGIAKAFIHNAIDHKTIEIKPLDNISQELKTLIASKL